MITSLFQLFCFVTKTFHEMGQTEGWSNEKIFAAILGAGSITISLMQPEERDEFRWFLDQLSNPDIREVIITTMADIDNANNAVNDLLISLNIKPEKK